MKIPRKEKMVPLSELIDTSRKLRWLGVVDEQRHLEIYKVWPQAAGEAVARQTRPIRMRNDVLHIAVSSPAWLQELSLLKPTLLANLKKILGGQCPRDLRFNLSETDLRQGA
jgi:predicted nucleic acid-binding Zn ribbon protein